MMNAMDVMTAVRRHAGAHFPGVVPQKASVTFLGLEPIEVLRFSSGDLVHYVTAGCARQPMADPASPVADPERGPRAELVLTHVASAPVTGVHRALAVLAAAPAVEGLMLVADALIDLTDPLWPGAAFTSVLLGESGIADLPLGPPASDVTFLRAVPVTATEAAWVRVRGAGALRNAWQESGIDPQDPQRVAASL